MLEGGAAGIAPREPHPPAGAGAQGIPPAKITAFNRLGWEYARRHRRAHSPAEQTAAFLWCGREFCRLVNATPWDGAGGVFTFNSAGLETLQLARGLGLRAVMEQTIAPRKVEQQILAREFAAHPDWQPQPEDALVEEYSDREREEWAAADTIFAGRNLSWTAFANPAARPRNASLCRMEWTCQVKMLKY